LIQHVWEAARQARSLTQIVIATDHERVATAVRDFGGEAVMTSPDHPNGTSRLAEAANALGLGADALVVNVQGDEPDLDPTVIERAISLACSTDAEVTTVASPFGAEDDPSNPNLVKVVLRRDSTALYFSRSLIPHARAGGQSVSPLKHIGIYLYRKAFLDRYVALAPTALEQCEMLEQLRVLEHGFRIAVAECPVTSQGIDTPEQYAAFVARFKGAQVRR
jgi:3-deoxy-manno-octulosonate cytidylyltransferase (CMP-KDO synthetase)